MQLDPQDGQEKQAGGEILGRFAQLLARPFVGAERGQAINRAIQSGVTRAINQPIATGLQKARIPGAIGKIVSTALTPIPHTPTLAIPQRIIDQRQQIGQRVGQGWANLMSENPEALLIPSPDPISGKVYIGAKKLLGKAIGAKSLLEKKAMMDAFADELVKIANGGMAKEAQVAPYQQETQWTCSAACLKAVLGHYGHDVPEELAVQAIGARVNKGAECNQIMWGAHKFGFDAFEFSFDSLEQAKFLLDQDIPIIADIQSFNHPGKGHFVVITAIDDQGVHLMDPNTPGNQRTISHEEMEDRWWDLAMAPPHDPMVKWGVVILPPEAP